MIYNLVVFPGDGTISFEEFQELMMRYKRIEQERGKDSHCRDADLKQTFQIFDKDKDGYLNACDLRQALSLTSKIVFVKSHSFIINILIYSERTYSVLTRYQLKDTPSPLCILFQTSVI